MRGGVQGSCYVRSPTYMAHFTNMSVHIHPLSLLSTLIARNWGTKDTQVIIIVTILCMACDGCDIVYVS